MVERQWPFFHWLCNRLLAQPIVSKDEGRWSDIYATLVANGHNAERIGLYTHRQVILFYEAAVRRELNARTALVLDVNMAQAGGKVATDHVANISKCIPR